MDAEKIGKVIKECRKEKGMTQKELAEKLMISDKTISKWERGLGCPDISFLTELSKILGVNIENILKGNIEINDFIGGNMKNSKYYVCPICGNVTVCTGNAEISCCGKKLEALEPKKADKTEKLNVEQIENDWYISSEHPMTKDHYISFIAFAKGDKIEIIKQYPEWNLQTRIQRRGHGKLMWYCTQHGFYYQYL